METRDSVSKILNIPREYIRCASRSRVVCLVCEEWLQTLFQSNVEAHKWKLSISLAESETLLAPSMSSIPSPWRRISIKKIEKLDKFTESLFDFPLCNPDLDPSLLAHLAETDKENYHNLWQASYSKYHGTGNVNFSRRCYKFSEFVHEFLRRIHPRAVKCKTEASSKNNIVPVVAVVETDSCFLLVQPYCQFSLQDVVSFSPVTFSSSHTKPLFILYQILNAMKTFHKNGITVKNLSLRNILVDSKLWIHLSNPHFCDFVEVNAALSDDAPKHQMQRLFSEGDDMVKEGCNFISSSQYCSFEIGDLSSVMDDWVHRKISNFKYLLVLNHLAGRRLGDPNHHPIIPWVMDFTAPDFGFRDLKKSKYRLNKGDNQLDLTFETFPGMDDSHIPHHVTDILSDITYYVYKARRTSKEILCAHVRSKWVPNEYPSSMQRMQEWTPDECIPEFFTDPSIFTSIHEDLPHIELPPWSSSAEDFISKHMEVLESEQVSEHLHHWIDLMFGYKLTGSAAVKAKNINLQLVDDHVFVTNRGVTQLFNMPHPNRIPVSQAAINKPTKAPKQMLHSQMLGDSVDESVSHGDKKSTVQQRPELATVHLPKNYEPLAGLEQIEALYNFTSKTMKTLPSNTGTEGNVSSPFRTRADIISEDMLAFGCVMCELYVGSSLHMLEPNASLHQRYSILKKMYIENKSLFPRNIHQAIEVLLQFSSTTSSTEQTPYDLVNCLGLPPPTPVQLLHPFVGVLMFPTYFPDLYQSICKLEDKDREAEDIKRSILYPPLEKLKLVKVIARDKVKILQEFLEVYQGKLDHEGLELILPYVEEVFQREVTAIPAAWSLFNLIGQEIGPMETSKRFLQHLVKLFSGENPSPKHMKIYHKTFLIQILLRLGLQTFLTNFSTLLVEAVAGYKDYVFENLFSDQQESEALEDFAAVNIQDSKDSDFLPAVEEEDNDDDDMNESESLYSTQSSDYPRGSTQDDIDEIEDNMMDDLSLNEESASNKDENGDFDSLSLSAEGSDDRSNKSDNELNPGESADRTSIHSITPLLDKFNDLGDSDVGSYGDRTDTLTEKENLQFEYQGDLEDNVEDNTTSRCSSMVRSETDEFAQSMSERTAEEVVNISDVATESIKWLSHRLGPILTAKFLSRNLIRMLALCYLGEEQLIVISESDKKFPKSSRLVYGDRNAMKILDCLSFIAQMYGEQVILLQYVPCIVDLVNTARKRLTAKAESGLISSLVLLRHILPLLADSTLMDILPDTILGDTLFPVVKLVSSPTVSFPGGKTTRTIICYKLIDAVYVMGLRTGFEMTRKHLTELLVEFYVGFNEIHGNGQTNDNAKHNGHLMHAQTSMDDSYCNIKIDGSTNEYTIGTPVNMNTLTPDLPWQGSRRPSPYSLGVPSLDEKDDSTEHNTKNKENILQELEDVFTPELAIASYIPFCRIFGSLHLEQVLPHDDLIRQLCARCDTSLGDSTPSSPCDEELSPSAMGSNVALKGNRIQLQEELGVKSPDGFKYGPINRSSRLLRVDPDETKSELMGHHNRRHLRGNWLAYWEHELGLNERDTMFNFKQIKLQTFDGHTSSIRSLTILDNENSFISASKDKTVKLWSIKSHGDGSHKSRCQYTYGGHKKSVFSVAYLESVRLVASCDSTVHIWDPFTCDIVQQLESPRYTPVTALIACPSPSPMIITATTDSTLRFLDLRTAAYAHEYRCNITNAGLIRCVTVSPDGLWLAVGFSSGLMSVLDLRTGLLLKTWKGHEGDILQMKAYNRNTFLTSSFDQLVKIWSTEDIKDAPLLKGQTEPVHCMCFYRNQVITGTTGNRIGVHSSLDSQGSFTGVKLKTDTFKGVLTSMAVLPMNRTLLLGADNGSIRLLC